MVGGGAQNESWEQEFKGCLGCWEILRESWSFEGTAMVLDDGGLGWQEARAWDGELHALIMVSLAFIRAVDKSVPTTC